MCNTNKTAPRSDEDGEGRCGEGEGGAGGRPTEGAVRREAAAGGGGGGGTLGRRAGLPHFSGTHSKAAVICSSHTSKCNLGGRSCVKFAKFWNFRTPFLAPTLSLSNSRDSSVLGLPPPSPSADVIYK